MNTEEKNEIIALCQKYHVFLKPGEPLSFTSRIKHERRPMRYRYIRNFTVTHSCTRIKYSSWSSPIWIMPKKLDASVQQKWRLVVDYRQINEKTIYDRYRIPNISDILDKLGRSQQFTVLDLGNGFHQIEIKRNSFQKTAFNVEHAHFEYLRMPFGLKNAP